MTATLRFARSSSTVAHCCAVVAALGLALVGGLSAAYAAAPAPGAALGDPIPVNATTANRQSGQAAAMDAAGDSVVVWTDEGGADGSGAGVFAQRYDSSGKPAGSEFQVNTYTAGDQDFPAVAMDAAGDFVVVWTSYDQAASDSLHDVYARRFRADGTADGGETLVNSTTANEQFNPAVAMGAVGGFVVTWQDQGGADGSASGIFARLYDAGGDAATGEFLVNTSTAGQQNMPAAAMDAHGNFVVVWEGQAAIGCLNFDVAGQRYAADGTPAGGEFQVNTETSGYQGEAAVAMDAAGDFVVAWQNQDDGIFARRYHANGTAAGDEFQVDTIAATAIDRGHPAVAMDAAGDFVVMWEDSDSADIPAAAMNAAGDWLAAWTDYNDTDGDGANISAQRYARESSLDLKSMLALAPSATVEPGASLTLTAGIANMEPPATLTGNATIDAALTEANGLTATLTLPAGAAFGKATGTGWTCPDELLGNVLTCTYGAPLAAASATENLTINVTAPASASTFEFSNAIFGNQPDSAADNDTALADVTVTPSGDDDSGANDSDGTGNGGAGNTGTGGSDTPSHNQPSLHLSGGGGALGFLAFGLLGLPLLRRRRRA